MLSKNDILNEITEKCIHSVVREIMIKVLAIAGAACIWAALGVTASANEATESGALGTQAVSDVTGATGTSTTEGLTLPVNETVVENAEVTEGTAATENATTQDANTEETTEQVVQYVQNNEVMASGHLIKTNLNGHYYARGVKGMAMTDQEWSLQKEAGMAMVEYFFVTSWDINQDTAPLAVETFRVVAAAVNAKLGPVVQININKTFNGKMTSLEGNPVKITTVVGIPDDFKETGAKYAVICVKSGGVFEILPDLDEDDLTVTFKANAGNCAYALIRY